MLGHVDDLGDEVLDPAVGVTHADERQVAVHHRAVRAQVTLREPVAVARAVDDLVDEGGVDGEVVGVGQLLPGRRPQGRLVAAEHRAEGPVDLEEGAVECDEAHADGGVPHRRLEPVLPLGLLGHPYTVGPWATSCRAADLPGTWPGHGRCQGGNAPPPPIGGKGWRDGPGPVRLAAQAEGRTGMGAARFHAVRDFGGGGSVAVPGSGDGRTGEAW